MLTRSDATDARAAEEAGRDSAVEAELCQKCSPAADVDVTTCRRCRRRLHQSVVYYQRRTALEGQQPLYVRPTFVKLVFCAADNVGWTTGMAPDLSVSLSIGAARIKRWGGQNGQVGELPIKHFWFYLYGFKIKVLCIKNVYI